ncbi:MAG: cation:proton antiporter [Rhizobiales bacterium]|nr:cation:proton antiporter [Hyphomicrobiales bacterium]
MPHEATLIATVAIGFVAAFACGYAADRLKLPPLVGYLVAGIIAGPYVLGFVGDIELSGQLAEMGVILLMFGVGLHFSIADLAAVGWIAIPGAVGQIAIATILGIGLSLGWGWSLGGGLVFGLSLSVASTVVVLRALEQRNALDSTNGRIAVGWLIVEDLATVVILVLLPSLAQLLGGHPLDAHGAAPAASGGEIALSLLITFAKVAAFVALAIFLGPRVVPWILTQVARTGSRELFTLSVLAVALGIAFGSAAVFGVSFALGAFFAGVVLSESRFSHRAAAESLPMQDAFAVLFFVSVGMLFDPSVLWKDPISVLLVVALIIVGKSVAAFLVVSILRFPVSTALTVSASLAQIGEFSFILIGLGISLGLLTGEARDLVLAGALISITLNQLVFSASDWLIKRLASRSGEFGARNIEKLRHTLQTVRERAEAREAERAARDRETVERFPLFAAVDPEKREELLLLFRPRTASPGDRIIRKGDRADGIYFISSGSAEVSIGTRKIRLGPGTFFGEMALLSGARRNADVTAVDYCELLVMTVRDFQQFMAHNPNLRAEIDRLALERTEMNRQNEAAEHAALEQH